MRVDEDDDDSDALIYKSKPDIDGGSHPSWEQQFTYTCTSLNFCLTYRSINFKPPSLTNCKIVITGTRTNCCNQCNLFERCSEIAGGGLLQICYYHGPGSEGQKPFYDCL